MSCSILKSYTNRIQLFIVLNQNKMTRAQKPLLVSNHQKADINKGKVSLIGLRKDLNLP